MSASLQIWPGNHSVFSVKDLFKNSGEISFEANERIRSLILFDQIFFRDHFLNSVSFYV